MALFLPPSRGFSEKDFDGLPQLSKLSPADMQRIKSVYSAGNFPGGTALPSTSPASAAAAMCLSAAETLPSLAVQATLQREGASQTGGGWRRRSRLTKSGASATARCGGWRGPWSRAGHRWCTRTVSEPLSRRHASRVRAHTPRNGCGEALSCCHDDVTMPLAAPIRLQGKAGLLLL